MGTTIHELLRVYYFLKRTGQIPHDKIVSSCIKRGRQFTSNKSDLSAEDIEFAFNTFRQYSSYYIAEQWIPQDVELSFVAKVFEDESYIFLVQGRVDLTVKIPSLPDIVIVDHKTRSRIKQESKLDNQKIIYSKFLKMSTFIINKVGLLKTKEPKDKFQREVISYSEDYVEEWYKEFIMTLKEMIAYRKLNFYKREPTSCDKWAGCVFKGWCNEEPKRRQTLINEKYIIGDKIWDVGGVLDDSRTD